MKSPFLGEKALELLRGRPVREEHAEDLLKPARPPRMTANLTGRCAKQEERLRNKEIRTKN